MAAQRIADVLIKSLANLGVKRIYGIVGDSLNGITDALQKEKSIEWVHTRHEEVAAFAAGAEAHLSGQLAVCGGSCGPGNLHLINGLYDCQRNRVPVLAIAAHIPSNEIGSGYFQETHPEILFKECSVFCEMISHAGQLPQMLDTAIQTAIAKRGVAVLVISGDTAMLPAANVKPIEHLPQPKPFIIPNEDELKQMAAMLNKSKKITLLCGYGCKNSHEALMKLAEKLQSPIVHALRGKEWVEYDNPYDVGMTGFIGFSSGYYAMEACDTLLALGTSFPYRQFYPEKANLIQVDINAAQLGKRARVDLGLVGDIGPTIEALLPYLDDNKNSDYLNLAVGHYHKAREKLDKLAEISDRNEAVHPQSVVKLISERASDDAIFTCDVGTPTVWAARYLKMNGRRRLIGSFNHGSMANALAQSIGAQSYAKNRQVIALCGDGGFSMLLGDFITLKQLNLPIKVVIINNGTLGFVELEMKASGILDEGTELQNPNFADMAKAMGIHGIRVEKPKQLAAGIDELLATKGPALLDVVTNRMELVMPPSITKEQVKGFSLYLTKAILNQRGDEIFELAKTNLWR